MIVAIDGPAGSGKSSTARELARRLDYLHVDSGAFYRALTYALMAAGVPQASWNTLEPNQIEDLDIRGERGPHGIRLRVGGEPVDAELRTPEVNASVSHVARIPTVRNWLNERLRILARSEDVVADGRDIGTVVFPRAELKVFLVADPEVRARRRLREQGTPEPDRKTLLAEIDRLKARDRADSERATAPLKPADDAVHVDTTALEFEEQIAAILELVRGRRDSTGDPVGP